MTHDVKNAAAGSLQDLVSGLPEKYQPIFGHPELSEGCSRACADRLGVVLEVASQLQAAAGRPVRVLDLGCAQGFFSLSLAAEGFVVHGVDFLERNVHVAQALAHEHGLRNATFSAGRIESVAESMEDGQYDLVLGLSVFHHLVHEHGLGPVHGIIDRLARLTLVGVFELAVREEPLYWGLSQPHDPATLLAPYALTRVLSQQATHLSGITRPLYFASNRYWKLGDDFRAFSSWRSESHGNSMNSHEGTRRYYFSDHLILKRMSLGNAARREVNLSEFENEIEFLRNPPLGLLVPSLVAHHNDGQELWILRDLIPGRLLSDLMQNRRPYAYEHVADGIIEQLVLLEASGLYHNDIRCWNVLLDEDGRVCFIDFGAISSTPRDCVWPDNLLLSLIITLRELVHGYVSPPLPTRRPLLDVTVLPARYRDAFLRILLLPRSEWSFAALREAIIDTKPVASQPPWTHIVSAQESALLIHEQALEACRTEIFTARQQLSGSLENAHRWYLRAIELEGAASASQPERDLTEDAAAGGMDFEPTSDPELQAQSAPEPELECEPVDITCGDPDLEPESGARTRAERALEDALRRRVEGLRLSFTEARDALQSTRRELENVRGDLQGSLNNAHHWYLRAVALEADLNAVHSSRSWRITRPLRALKHPAQSCRLFSRRVVVAVMRRVVQRPMLGRGLNGILSRLPWVHRRLRDLAVRNALVPPARAPDQYLATGGVQHQGLSESLAKARLSSRGREFYQRMLDKRQREQL